MSMSSISGLLNSLSYSTGLSITTLVIIAVLGAICIIGGVEKLFKLLFRLGAFAFIVYTVYFYVPEIFTLF